MFLVSINWYKSNSNKDNHYSLLNKTEKFSTMDSKHPKLNIIYCKFRVQQIRSKCQKYTTTTTELHNTHILYGLTCSWYSCRWKVLAPTQSMLWGTKYITTHSTSLHHSKQKKPLFSQDTSTQRKPHGEDNFLCFRTSFLMTDFNNLLLQTVKCSLKYDFRERSPPFPRRADYKAMQDIFLFD